MSSPEKIHFYFACHFYYYIIYYIINPNLIQSPQAIIFSDFNKRSLSRPVREHKTPSNRFAAVFCIPFYLLIQYNNR